MAGSTVRFQVDLDEEALRDRIIEVIAGHAVVKPGETLVIRLKDWDAGAVEYYQEYLDARDLPFRVLAVVGDELAVAKSEAQTVVEVHATAIAKDAAVRVERSMAKAARTRGTDVRTLPA